MTRSLSLLLAIATLSACGGSVCTRIETARQRVFGSKTTCEYTNGTSSVKVTMAESTQCESKLSSCTAADQTLLNDFAKCLEAAPACTAGNEKAAADAVVACNFMLVDTSTFQSKLSSGCGL